MVGDSYLLSQIAILGALVLSTSVELMSYLSITSPVNALFQSFFIDLLCAFLPSFRFSFLLPSLSTFSPNLAGDPRHLRWIVEFFTLAAPSHAASRGL